MKKKLALISLLLSLAANAEVNHPLHLYKIKVTALVILGEARGEGKEGMRSVAGVIHERAKDPRWSDDYYHVATQTGQFEAYTKALSEPYTWWDLLDTPEGDTAMHFASLLDKGIDPCPVEEFNHFYAFLGGTPKWAKGQPVTIVGNHAFLEL